MFTFGCAANRAPLTCPHTGGPSWKQIRSSHFVMKTDLEEGRGKQILTAIEILRAALLTAMDAPADDPEIPVEVIVFERHEDFTAVLTQPNLRGIFISYLAGDVEMQPVIVSFGGLTYGTRSNLLHEITHQVVRRHTAHLPWWLDEGLAELYSTLWVKDGVAMVGDPTLDVDFWEREDSLVDVAYGRAAKVWLPRAQAPDFETLIHANRLTVTASGRQEAYYAAAWKLLHVLRGHKDSTYEPRFGTMMAALMKGTDGEVAFKQAYEGIPLSRIAVDYREMLLDHGEYPSAVKFEPPANLQLEVLALTDPEVHALWARLLAHSDQPGRPAQGELDRGVAESPGALPLLYARASLHLQTRDGISVKDDVATLLKADGNDPRYLLLAVRQAMAVSGSGEPELVAQERAELTTAVDKLLRLAASPAQRSMTAAVLGRIGRRAEGLALSEKSVKSEPSCGFCFIFHAELLLADGRAGEARTAAQKALTLLPDGSTTKQLEALLARIEKALAAGPVH